MGNSKPELNLNLKHLLILFLNYNMWIKNINLYLINLYISDLDNNLVNNLMR